LAKQEKLTSNILANQLGKNINFAKLIAPRGNIRADPGWHRRGQARWEGEKKK
jgi:hypothetical protein